MVTILGTEIPESLVEMYELEETEICKKKYILVNKPCYIALINPIGIEESESAFRIKSKNAVLTLWKEILIVHMQSF